MPRRTSAKFLILRDNFHAFATGVVHEAGIPRPPSICTTHNRHEPNGSMLSVAHSLGISMPMLAAARITDVPAGTVTLKPSISKLTFQWKHYCWRAKIFFFIQCSFLVSSFIRRRLWHPKIFGEMI
jgi:hypothetical protein